MNKPFEIVLHNDLDGGASGVCIVNHIVQKYGLDAKYHMWFGTYTNVDQYVERLMDNPEQYEKVFIADISVNVDLAKQFPQNFVLLDHHDTAKPLDGINKCIVDTTGNHCGASLCYKHLLIDEKLEYKHLRSLTAIALDYDLWHHKLPKNIAKNLNFIYYYYWGDKFVSRFKNGFDGFNAEEQAFLKLTWDDIKKQIETCTYTDLMDGEHAGKLCLIVLPNSKGETNELCEHAIKNLKFDVVMCVNSSRGKISTRISEKAEKAGLHIGEFHAGLKIGGGHPRAGGASYQDDKHLETICEALADKIMELKI